MASLRRSLLLPRSLTIRNVSAAAAKGESIKPPVQVFGVEGRYATALFSAASKEKSLDKVESELASMNNLLTNKPKVLEVLLNPMLKTEQKKRALNDIAETLKFSSITTNLLYAMVENNRTTKVVSMIRSYSQLMSAHRGEVTCTVTTAKTLSSAELKSLQDALKGFTKKQEVLKLNTKVDKDIIGGVVVEIGDKYVDLSTATKVKKLVGLLKEAV